MKVNVRRYKPPEPPKFTVFWAKVISPLRNTMSLIERNIKEAGDEFFGVPEGAETVIIEESLRTDNNNTVKAPLDFLFQN